MENEKRKVGDYTVLCAVNIGSREIILAENEQSANGERFLCCYGERNDIFEKFSECAVGDDYIDAALFFAERIKKDAEQFRAEVEKLDDGKLDCNSLETIYEKFNIDHPADYKGRSLSVSDVVEIRESDTLNPGFYFVDSIGFKSISFDKSLCKEPVEAGSGKISVLLVEPNKYPKMIEIDDTLEAMQAVVGGDIEEYMPFEDEVAIICNEEGKVNGLTPNRAVYEENSREMLDIICGKFFIAYAPFDAERFQSLPPDLAEKYREKFKYPERFMRVNNEIVAVPFKPVRADKER